MDSFLAELYGTNEPTSEDFEKVAHLDFLQKIAEEEGIDLDELSDEELEELAEVAAEAMDGEGYADDDEEYDEDDMEKEAEAKVEEADFLGRVMAHSFNQEMDSIEMEKDAGRRYQAVKGAVGKGWRGAKAVGREAFGRTGRAAKQTGREVSRAVMKSPAGRFAEPAGMGARMKQKADYLARRVGRGLGAKSVAGGAAAGAAAGAKAGWKAKRPGGRARRALDWMAMGRRRRAAVGAAKGARGGGKAALRSQRRRGYGALGAGAGLAAGAGLYAANREKRSADEMWEDAIQARAWEHLMAAGLADEQGNFIPAEELDKTAGIDDSDYEVDAAALELLEAEGYPVEWY